MMTSYPENIKTILEAIVSVNPKRILDIGSAFGKYSLLAREAIMSERAVSENLTPADDLEIGCVEMAKYFQDQPYHEKLYQYHYHQDARNIDWKELPKFDLVLMIDVLEHWSMEDGVRIINELLAQGSKILVSTPKEIVMYTEDFYGTDCPKHETQWTRKDFFYRGLGNQWTCEDRSNDNSHIILIEH